MKITTKKQPKVIENDEQYLETWEETCKLDGRANALIEISNKEIADPLKEAKKADRQRNNLLTRLNIYREKNGWDKGEAT